MKRTKMDKIIDGVRTELDWPTLDSAHDQPFIRIISNPKDRSHIIYLPAGAEIMSADLDYLHEFGHALFCERVHPIFAANAYFSQQTNKRDFQTIAPALSAAVDWFLSHWMVQKAPLKVKDQWRENLTLAEELLQNSSVPPFEVFLDTALAIAQAIHFLHEPIDCGGVLQDAVQAMLDTPPDQPSAEACVSLVNKFLASATPKRARLINDGEFDLWELYLPDEAHQETVPAS